MQPTCARFMRRSRATRRSERSCCTAGSAGHLLLGGERSEPRHNGVEVVRAHLGVKLKTHRRLELAAVPAHPLRDGALDLGVGPVAQSLALAGGDIAGVRYAPRARKFRAAGAKLVGEIATAFAERRVALHTVADGGKVEA